MAQQVMPVAPPEVNWPIVGALAGALTAIFVPFFTWLTSRRKNDIDESATLLDGYQGILAIFQAEVASVKKEFADYKLATSREFAAYKASTNAEMETLRERVRGLEDELRDKNRYITGLERQLGQQGRSTYRAVKQLADEAQADRADNSRGAPTADDL